MADDKSFHDSSAEFNKESEATEKNLNFRSDDIGHANPDRRQHEDHSYSLLSASSFSHTTGFASALADPLSFQAYSTGSDISASDWLVGAPHRVSKDSGQKSANALLGPAKEARDETCPTDANLSSPSKSFSSRQDVGRRKRKPEPQESLGKTGFGADESAYKKRKEEIAEFFPQKKLSHSASASSSETTTKRLATENPPPTTEDRRELGSASAAFPPIEFVSNIEMATDRASVSSASAGAVFVVVLSGIQILSPQIGKESTFVCGVCNKAFVSKRNLDRHSRTHNREKLFSCDICGKMFAQARYLKQHLLVHSEEKLHTCTVCGKKFRRKYELTEHFRKHSKEKPFTCDICGREHAHKSGIRAHIRTHTGGAIHQCAVCRRDFASKDNCTEHQEREHGGK